MNIEIIGIGPDTQEHVKELKKKLEGLLESKDDSKRAKASIGELVGELLHDQELDPRAVMSALMGLSAIVANCYCKANAGLEPRKAFKKMAGLAWDTATEIKAKVDENE